MIEHSYGVKNMGRSFFSFVTIHVFDGRADIFLIDNTALHSMQRFKMCATITFLKRFNVS